MAEPPELTLAVAGAHGRMGRAVAEAAAGAPRIARVLGFERAGDGEGLIPRDVAIQAADVVIDFTSSSASAELAQLCAARGGPALVIGSTGFTHEEAAALDRAAATIPIVRSGNFSLGVNLLAGLVRQAARLLDASAYDIEVFEAHHRRKRDAPSGTALMLGQAAAEGRRVDLGAVEVRARDGVGGERIPGSIGFSVLRGGGIVGEHSVVFAAEDEILTFSHSARDRGLFARGALAAALWVHGRGPGLYGMEDVLGL